MAAKQDSIEVNISQKLDLVKCNKKMIVIRMTRSIESEDSDEFKLVVSSIGKFYLEEKSFENFKSLEEMEEYANERKSFLVDKVQMGAVLTQIIANITGTFGRTPTILPPVINEKTFKNK